MYKYRLLPSTDNVGVHLQIRTLVHRKWCMSKAQRSPTAVAHQPVFDRFDEEIQSLDYRPIWLLRYFFKVVDVRQSSSSLSSEFILFVRSTDSRLKPLMFKIKIEI